MNTLLAATEALPTPGPLVHPGVQLLLATAAVITAVGVIWRKAIKPVVRGVQEVMVYVAAIHAEFQPNGGESTRDRLDRIEINQETTVHAVHRLEARVSNLEFIVGVRREEIIHGTTESTHSEAHQEGDSGNRRSGSSNIGDPHTWSG